MLLDNNLDIFSSADSNNLMFESVDSITTTNPSCNNNLILQEAPKLNNNDLLLENLDFNLIDDSHSVDNSSSFSVSTSSSTSLSTSISCSSSPSSSSEVESSVFNTVFQNENDVLLNNFAVDDNELKQIFNFNDSDDIEFQVKLEEEDLFGETRSKSTPIPKTNTAACVSAVDSDADNNDSKRSFSTADLDNYELANDCKKRKVNDLGCTPYARKQRNLPLPPVVPKGDDLASVKRARNTEAARRSRARKMQRMSQLENKCEILLKENLDLKSQIESLKALLAKK